MELLLPVLSSLATSVPLVIVDVVLLVVAMARWNKHPRVSMLACTAAVLLLVMDVLVRAAWVVIPLRAAHSGRSLADTGWAFAVFGGLSSVMHAVAMGLLVAAVFSDRGPASSSGTPRAA